MFSAKKKLVLLLFVISTFTYSQEKTNEQIIYLKTSGKFKQKKSWGKFNRITAKYSDKTPKVLISKKNSRKNGSSTPSILRLSIPSSVDFNSMKVEFMNTGIFSDCEKSPIFEVFSHPNDPYADSSFTNYKGEIQLISHNFYDAWEIEKGDTNVVIGIIDTGTDFSQEDLQGKVIYNFSDPIDSINNDGDYLFDKPIIDNYRGWDLADWDNDPSFSANKHGLSVTGVVAASTNNGTGIAGTAYNCKYIPIKVSPDVNPSSITHGYEGVMYAAEHDFDVINLSWGRPFLGSPIFQEIINYAVLDKDVVVIAAAGNSGTERRYYPAGLDNVISVAGLKGNDEKQGKGTYHHSVDVCAVGQFVRTTQPGNEYKIESGSSMAAPIVSGAAALLRSHFPDWTAQQIGEQLRVTGDVIDTIPFNLPYKNKLGKKLNPYRALSDTTIPSVRVLQTSFSNFPYFNAFGDTLSIQNTFKNYLRGTENLEVTVKVESNNAIMVDSVVYVGSINTLDSYTNESFKMYVSPEQNETEHIVLHYIFSDGEYEDHQYIEVDLIKSYLIASSDNSTLVAPSQYITTYPNPFNETISLSNPDLVSKYSLYDLSGRLLIEKNLGFTKNKNISFKNLNLAEGSYFLRLELKDGTSESITVMKQ